MQQPRAPANGTIWAALYVFGFFLTLAVPAALAQSGSNKTPGDDWVCVPSATRASGWECGRGANKPEQRDPLPPEPPETPEADAFLARNPSQAVPRPGVPARPPQAAPIKPPNQTSPSATASSNAPDESGSAPAQEVASTSSEVQDSPSPPEFLTPHAQDSLLRNNASSASTSSQAAANSPTVADSATSIEADNATAQLDSAEQRATPEVRALPDQSPPAQTAATTNNGITGIQDPADARVTYRSPNDAQNGDENDGDARNSEARNTPGQQAAASGDEQTGSERSSAQVTGSNSNENSASPANNIPTTQRESFPGSSMEPGRYTIQLANVNQAVDLGLFLARHGIDPAEVRSVAASYEQGTRYLVLWGSFPSWAQARAALNAIPGSGEIDGAWIRGLDGITVLREVAVERPTSDTVSSSAPRSEVVATSRTPPEPAQTIYSDPVVSSDLDELLSADPRWYTVQLASMRERASIDRYIEVHDLHAMPVTTARIWRDGGDWYLLLYGAWPSLAEARTAQRSLPGSVQAEGPWTRRLGPIQDEFGQAQR